MNLTTSSASDKRYTASTADIPGPSEPGSNSGSTEQKEDVNLVQTSLGHQIGIKRKAVSLDRPVTSILFSNDEVNYLIYRYLEENGKFKNFIVWNSFIGDLLWFLNYKNLKNN